MTRERTVHRVSRLWHRPLALGIALLVVQAGAPAAAQEASPAAATIELAPCDLIASEGRQEVNARCGTLAVPLDFDNPEGEQIQLFVAVVDALAEEAEPDPLVVIAGGPGDASTRFFAMSEAAFSRILRRRDRRPRGPARHGPIGRARLRSPAGRPDARRRRPRRCRANDPRLPRRARTRSTVLHHQRRGQRSRRGPRRSRLRAHERVRHLLRHTRCPALPAALSRADPQRHPGWRIAAGCRPRTGSGHRQPGGLDALFQRCATDDPCHAAFPELRERFYALLDRLDQAPVAVTIDHPRTGEATRGHAGSTGDGGGGPPTVYSPQTASVLPVLVDSAYAGDYRALASQALFLEAGVKDIAIGLNYAVVCTEDTPYVGDLDMAAQAEHLHGDRIRRSSRPHLRQVAARNHGQRSPGTARHRSPGAPVERRTRSDHPARVRAALRRQDDQQRPRGRPGPGPRHVDGALRATVDGRFRGRRDPGALDLACVERVGPFPLFTSPLGPSP